MILWLHRFQVKEFLIREARRRGKLDYQGQPIRIVEDHCQEVMSKRAEYRAVMTELYNPARLRISVPTEDKKWLRSANEAQSYLDNLPGSSHPP